MKFASPEYFYLLLIIPLFVFLRFFTYYQRRKALRKLGDKHLVYQMMPLLSLKRENIKFSLVLLIFATLVTALARPQMGTKISRDERNGIEVMIAMDISNSMLAEDVVPSRLDKTKLLIENLVDHFKNDRIGLVVFAGDAFVQLPITNDYVSAKMFMHSINTTLIHSQGTNIADAINICRQSFTNKENIGRAIILITDGEDHEGGAEEAAAEANKQGCNVYVLGVGSAKGAPVPDIENGGYMRDYTGSEVMSALNETMCQGIASAGRGTYIHVENNNRAQEQLNEELAKLQKGQMDSVVYSEYEEQYQWLLWLMLLLVLVELFTSETSTGVFTKLSRLSTRSSRFAKTKADSSSIAVKALLCLMALQAVSLTASAQTDRQYVRSGNKYYHEQKFDKAEIEYRKALQKNPKNAEALYNLGCAKMMQENDSIALDYYQKASTEQKEKMRKAQVFHNAGVVLQNHQDYAKAVDAYKESLRNNPADDETRYNLALCQKLLKKQQQNQQNQDKNQDKNDKDKKNDKNKDQNKDKKKDDKQDDKNKDKQNPKQDPQQQDPQQSKQEKINKENAEQMLNAAKNAERAVQEKVKRAQQRRQNTSRQKNW